MRLCLILAICVLTVNALPIDDVLRRETGVNGWYVPQWDGSLKWIGLAEAEAQMAYYEDLEKHESQSRLSTNTVKFYLYTRQNPSQGQLIKATKDSIDASYFNPNNPTRFTIHGWNSNYKDGVNTGVASAWFSYGDYNMIAVDWSRGRSLEYATSVAAVSGAGKKIADLIDYLVKNYQMSLDELEVVGFSLGAHVAGYTAKQVTTGQVRKVVGLDPASPLISYSKPAKRLSSDDAFYVETIQTNGGTLGFTNPIGKASFYPNGGKSQPGCGIDITGSCSHTRAVTYYIECLLNDNYASVKCPTHTDANKKNCGSTYSSVRMGSLANEVSAEGPYYVPLNSVSPYGMGEEISPTPVPTTTTTQEPVTTLKPEVPEETTAAPEENETSKAPEENETSAAPEVPEETTAAPEENETSKAPEENETSAAPEVPKETTAAPEENETSKAPEENETSAAPEVPEETTAAPEDNETTAAPEDNETTAAPEDNETTAAPEDNETTAAPEDNETTAAPEDNETTDAPEDNETTAAPEDNETTAAPEDNETTAAPEDNETTAAPEDNETTDAPEDNETTAAPEDNETTAAPEDNETTAAPEDNETTAAPEDNETTAAPEDNETSEDPEDNKTTSAPEEIETTSTTEDGGWGTPITVPPHDDDDKKGQSKNIYILNLIFMNVNVNGVSKPVNAN